MGPFRPIPTKQEQASYLKVEPRCLGIFVSGLLPEAIPANSNQARASFVLEGKFGVFTSSGLG